MNSIATSQRYVGNYVIRRTSSGQTVAGVMVAERAGRFLHTTTQWETGDVRHGLAMPHHDRLVMAYGPKDKVEIGVYELSADGQTLNGLWVPPGAARDDLHGCGEEISERTDADPQPYPDGTWTIRRAVAIDAQPYTGTLTTTPRDDQRDWPRAIDLAWALHDGDYASFGLAFEDALYTTFSFEPEQPYGVVVYTRAGNDWSGTAISSAATALAHESLRREQ